MKKYITIIFALVFLQSCGTTIYVIDSQNIKINIDGKSAEKKAHIDDVRASFYNVTPTHAVSYEKMMELEKKKEND